jgi:hypothetical protein
MATIAFCIRLLQLEAEQADKYKLLDKTVVLAAVEEPGV